MQFIQGNNRHQTYFTTADEQVSADNAVRLMDAFIDKHLQFIEDKTIKYLQELDELDKEEKYFTTEELQIKKRRFSKTCPVINHSNVLCNFTIWYRCGAYFMPPFPFQKPGCTLSFWR